MGRQGLRVLLALACGIAVVACNPSPPPKPSPSPSPPAPPRYRVTGLIRASCYQTPPNVGQGFCSLHAQIQNDGGPGYGGIGELILQYHPKDSDELVTATCDAIFPALDTKDVAEIDCPVGGDPLIYSSRIVNTDITFLPLDSPTPK